MINSLKATLAILSWFVREFVDKDARRYYRGIVVWTFITQIAEIAATWCLGLMVVALTPGSTTSLKYAFFGLALAHVVALVTKWRTSQSQEMTIGQAFRGVFTALNRKFFSKNLSLHLSHPDLLGKAVMDKGWQRADNLIHLAVFWTVQTILVLVITLPVLAKLNAQVWGIVTLALMVSTWLSLYTNQSVLKDAEPVDKASHQMFDDRNDAWEAVERVKLAGQGEAITDTLDQRFAEILEDDRPVWLGFNTRNLPRNAIMTAAFLGVVWLLKENVQNGTMTTGSFVAISTWVAIAVAQTHSLSNLQRQISWALPALITMKKGLDLPCTVVDGPNAKVLPNEGPAHIRFENVSFQYGEGPAILRNVDFEIKAGTSVALVGPTGSGKSTILGLMVRKMDPTRGAVFVNGRNLREDVVLDSWLEQVAYVQQKPRLLNTTIRGNLTFGLPLDRIKALTDDDLWAILRKFHADFGDRLSNGLDTKVGKNGIELSGGQAQRLMIAAAVLRGAATIIIDEATNALDAHCQAAVQDALNEALAEGVTAIIIAHRLSTLRGCDKFIFLGEAPQNDETPQIRAVAPSMEQLAEECDDFRDIAVLEGVDLTSK